MLNKTNVNVMNVTLRLISHIAIIPTITMLNKTNVNLINVTLSLFSHIESQLNNFNNHTAILTKNKNVITVTMFIV